MDDLCFGSVLVSLALCHRIVALAEFATGGLMGNLGIRESDVGIFAQGHGFLFAAKAIVPPPQLAARFQDQQIQPSAVSKPVCLFRRLSAADFHVCKCHIV